jgi:hypothetical protein
MMAHQRRRVLWVCCLGPAVLALAALPAAAELCLGPAEIVQAGQTALIVNGYSVPCYADWDNDGRKDLLVGQGGVFTDPRVRLYLNVGTASAPQFSGFSFLEADGLVMDYSGPSCPSCLRVASLGLFPRVVYWDADGRKDLLVGQADGTVRLYSNVGTDDAPVLDAGALLEVGQPGSKQNIVADGGQATPTVADWNSDGRKDVLVGGFAGRIMLFLNEGTDAAPDFRETLFVQNSGADLLVPTGGASPEVLDANDDGKKDLLVGNTDGQLLLYLNAGTDAAPTFSGSTPVEADGVPIDLDYDARSRPFVCDWTGDGLTDVLIGSGFGTATLHAGVPEPAALGLLGLGGLALVVRRTRRGLSGF